MQCFHKRNLAMRTSKSKALQWERRDLLSRMRPKCGPNLDLLRTISRYFHQNAVKSLNSTFCDKSAMLFIMNGLLYHPISIKLHVLTLVLNLIDSSLSLFHSFAATFLSWLGKWDLLIEMRPKCGLFHQFGPHADQVRNCGLLWKQWISAQSVWSLPDIRLAALFASTWPIFSLPLPLGCLGRCLVRRVKCCGKPTLGKDWKGFQWGC